MIVWLRDATTDCKYESVAKHQKCDYVTTGGVAVITSSLGPNFF